MTPLIAESARISGNSDNERLSSPLSSLSSLIDRGTVSLEMSSASALSACQRSSASAIEASSSVLRSTVASVLRSPVASVRSRCRGDFSEAELMLIVVAFFGFFSFNFVALGIIILFTYAVVLSIL